MSGLTIGGSQLDASWFLLLSAILFTIGTVGVLIRRNPLVILICIELMLNAVNLTLITFSRQLLNLEGPLFALMSITVAAAAILLAGRGLRRPRIVTQIVGPGVVWASFIGTLALFVGKVHGDYTYWTWIKSGTFEVPFNLLVDNLSIFMCLVITGVGGLIVTYSIGYMEHEDGPSYARFFTYMDVFIFSMLLLVLAGNFVFLIVGWAMVGLSSYLLIGFWYQRRSAVLAAQKAFVMNVIGDVGMILGAFVLFVNLHAITYSKVFDALPCANGKSCAGGDYGWL